MLMSSIGAFTRKVFFGLFSILGKNKLLSIFAILHSALAIGLGRLFAFAPDESGYLYTFNNLYGNSADPNPQYQSGWITAPKAFLWVAYLPSKLLTLLGMPDYAAIRFLSIALTLFSILMFRNIYLKTSNLKKNSDYWIFAAYLIPSVFLWTTVGLRESFIIAEITAFLVGFNYLWAGRNIKGAVLIAIGSYGLLSTKSYLWLCLVLATLICCGIIFFQRASKKLMIRLLTAGILIPLALFACTTSVYALSFILKSDITETGNRSGDSITQIYVDESGNTGGIGGGKPSKGDNQEEKPGDNQEEKPGDNQEEVKLITFHGDFTLVALYFYLQDNPNSILTKVMSVTNIKTKVEQIWSEKLKLGLIYKDVEAGSDSSSLNGHILTPGKIDRPLSMGRPAFVFLFGPFPLIGDPGFAAAVASFESVLWWLLYLALAFQFFRFRRSKLLKDPTMILSVIFTLGFIAFSALVEVNLGTSFRHRSVLLVPIIFMFLRLRQRSVEMASLTPYSGP
jgi:hypothetical protein